MPTRAEQEANIRRALSGLAATPAPAVPSRVTWHPVPSGWVWGGASGGLGCGPCMGEIVAPNDPRAQFVAWLARAYPGVVSELVARFTTGAPSSSPPLPAGVSGLGQSVDTTSTAAGPAPADSSLLDKIVSAAQSILPAYLQYQSQQQVLDVQLQRMASGLPPLDTAQYAPTMQIGLDPATIRNLGTEAATQAASAASAVSPLFLLGAIGAAIYLATKKKGR